MSLRDTACYTLTINPSSTHPEHIELSETGPNGKAEVKYVRVRESREGEVYSGIIYDAFSGAKLASMGYESAKEKKRRLELHGPDETVPFEFTGKINFEWTFRFQHTKFRWVRELYGKDYICTMDRRPDPRVEICLAREADKKDPARLEILHYNLDRFVDEIKDLRGLETLLVASLMMITDAAEDRSAKSGSSVPKAGSIAVPETSPTGSSSSYAPPPLPAKPPKLITEDDYEPESPNEIVVGLHTDLDGHVARAVSLLEDQHTLFVVIRTRNPAAAQKALEVSLGVTRFRHRETMGDLHQYVIEEEPFQPFSPQPASRPGAQVIKLDDPVPPPEPLSPMPKATKGWTAPNIAIYLSKIELPDLKPGRRESVKAKQNGERIPSQSITSPIVVPQRKSPSLLGSASKLRRSSKQSPLVDLLGGPCSSSEHPAPPPPEKPSADDMPSTSASGQSSGGVSLTRLFKAAASKV